MNPNPQLSWHGKLTANQFDKFTSSRKTSRPFFGVDLVAIDVYIQCAGDAGAQPNWNTELTFDIVPEAHGLRFDVTSKETAFDLDRHIWRSSAETIPESDFTYEYTYRCPSTEVRLCNQSTFSWIWAQILKGGP